MVWEEILIGFTVAGFMAVLVPESFWKLIFLADHADAGGVTGFLVALENAAVAPFVAAATFIGSMGNIPLATVLNSGGVLFAGIMGFIYSDLMVPPLVSINAKYYGWRVALYIAGVMYISIVITALILHFAFAGLGITPESVRKVGEVARFAVDYTLVLNIAFAGAVMGMAWLARAKFIGMAQDDRDHQQGDGLSVKRAVALAAGVIVTLGVLIHLFVA